MEQWPMYLLSILQGLFITIFWRWKDALDKNLAEKATEIKMLASEIVRIDRSIDRFEFKTIHLSDKLSSTNVEGQLAKMMTIIDRHDKIIIRLQMIISDFDESSKKYKMLMGNVENE